MTKTISCSDAGKDCGWSASAESEEELMTKVTEQIELNAENISSIKSLIKED